jgi:transcriptional regulator with XRE-family HTH domain
VPRSPHIEAIDKEIGDTLRKLRLRAGLTEQGLGIAIGVSFAQVQKYENGKNRIALSTLIQICKVLDVHPMEFIGQHFETGETSVSSISQSFVLL